MSQQGYANQQTSPGPGMLNKQTVGGIGTIEQSIAETNQVLNDVFEHLYHLQARLYPPRPSPVAERSEATHSSIESTLNQLAGRMRELRNLTSELING